ncbi:hypothetical protein [uncultured Oscillibacter sp.]|uniref:hypothetical protein n=1 Tax=uncultured Oscillibacter sp. TaxID=876091 RepID=UPI00261D64B9|nr:hypothetical protein [uncultured Oscillibacter sp.]
MNAKYLAAALCGCVLAGCLTGCGPSAAARSGGPALTAAGECTSLAAQAGDSEAEAGPAERFRPYAPFGLRYDAEKDELRFDGQLVRWFEDYYPLSEDGAQAGNDFFNEDGVVDVYAVRDRSGLARRADGSYDPSGTLVGVEAFSEEAFAARDVEALRNSAPVTAVAGDGEGSEEELNAIAAGYAPFGVTYDAEEDQWYYNGEAVCFFRDVLISNGESLSGGGFRGVMRTFPGERGTVRVETVRDYTRPDAFGYGTLTGIRTIQDS